MNTPTQINTGFQLCDGSDSEGEAKDASISPILSHAEVPQLQNISRIAVAIEMQEDFLTRIYEGVSGCFPDLFYAMLHASVSSDTQIPVLTINQRHLFVHPPYGMVSRIQGYVQYKTYSVHVLMRLWRKENFEDIEEITALCGIIGEPSHYKFCSGISLE